MADILGYSDKQVARIMSSDYAIIKIDGGQTGLVQSVQAGYQHNVMPKFEAGSHHLYWVTGQGQGSVSVGRSVGTAFLGFNGVEKAADGDLIPLSLTAQPAGSFEESKSGEAGVAKNLSFIGGVVQSLSFSFNTGGLEVSEQIQISVGSLEKG